MHGKIIATPFVKASGTSILYPFLSTQFESTHF